jgi:hypothetical protein
MTTSSTTNTTCSFAPEVDAHFDRGLLPEREHELRMHLPGCAACKKRYERHLLLESLTPGAPGPKARLRRGLPLPLRGAAERGLRWVAPAFGALAVAAALVLFVGPPVDSGFHARGHAATPVPSGPRLDAFRLARGAPPARLGDMMRRDDELAFTYANPTGMKYLLVFAVDEERRVYWYYPAWTRAEDDPQSVPIAAGGDPLELKEGISHGIGPGRMRLYGVFTDEPLHVRAIEARVASAPPLAPSLGIPGALEQSRLVEVQ